MQSQPAAAPASTLATPNSAPTTAYTVHYETPPFQAPATWYEKPWLPALLALLGVLIGLWWKWRTEKHERRLAIKERIYLKTLETVHELPIIVGSLSDPLAIFQDVRVKMGESLSTLAQAEVVASMPLIIALSDFKNIVMQKNFVLLRDRLKIETNKSDIARNEKQIEQNTNLMSQIREIYLKSSTPEHDKRLGNEWTQAENQSNDLLVKNNEIYQENLTLSIAMSRYATKMAAELVPHKAKLLRLVRGELKELGEKFDEKSYTELYKKVAGLANSSFESLASIAESSISNKSKDKDGAIPPSESPPDALP